MSTNTRWVNQAFFYFFYLRDALCSYIYTYLNKWLPFSAQPAESASSQRQLQLHTEVRGSSQSCWAKLRVKASTLSLGCSYAFNSHISTFLVELSVGEKHRKNVLRKREFRHAGLCVKNRHLFISLLSRDVETPEGRNPTGFSDLPRLKLGLTLLKAVFCLGGQKSRLDCGPWGLDPAALNAREVNTLLKDALDLLNCAAEVPPIWHTMMALACFLVPRQDSFIYTLFNSRHANVFI